jgi:hypothetical protein
MQAAGSTAGAFHVSFSRARETRERRPPLAAAFAEGQATAETAVLRARWSPAKARPPKPASIITQVEASGRCCGH